jgi:hypothetical protein
MEVVMAGDITTSPAVPAVLVAAAVEPAPVELLPAAPVPLVREAMVVLVPVHHLLILVAAVVVQAQSAKIFKHHP